MSESYERSNNLSHLCDIVVLMLKEVGLENSRFMSDKARDILVDDLVESHYDNFSYQELREMLSDGIRGYKEFTDLELISDHMMSYTTNMYEDFEFEGTIWHTIEQELLSVQTRLINKAIDTTVLK